MRVLLVLIALAWAGAPLPARASEPAWTSLREGGTVAVIRHARAPGTGDPAAFRVEDCATQRNLSEEGRAQARALGERFRAEGVAVERVLSSQWCRCLDTARLAFGEAEPLPALNSTIGEQDADGARLREVRGLVEGWRGRPGVLVLVTHQVNVTALTGIYPAEGEAVVLRPRADSGFDLVARFRPAGPGP